MFVQKDITTEMKKVLVVDMGAVWGGQEVYTTNFVGELRNKGFSVTHVSSQDKHNIDPKYFIKIGIGKLDLFKNISILNSLIGINDVIIFNGNRSIQQSFFLRKKKKFFGIKHGPFSVTNTNAIALSLIKFIYFFLFKKLDKLICVAKVTYQECQSFLHDKNLVLVPNGVKSTPNFIPKRFDDGIRAVYCGRLVEDKGIKTILEAVHLTHKNGKVKINLDIFGDGPLLDFVLNYIKTNHLENTITYHGFVSNSFQIYSNVNLMLFASRYEGMPLSILEAFSFGIPVLAYKAPGVKEIIDNGNNGFLIDDNSFNPDSMSHMLEVCLANYTLSELSERTRLVYEEHYSFDNMFEKLCNELELK
jgi:glycosyltransferase involved in cell wall biosynthesis